MSTSARKKELRLRTQDGTVHTVSLTHGSGSLGSSDSSDSGVHAEVRITLGDGSEASVLPSSTGVWSVLSPRGSFEVQVDPPGTGSGEGRDQREVEVRVRGNAFHFAPDDPRSTGAKQRAATQAEIRAPMPGKVVKILVAEGEAIEAGQGVLLFEAMKMQNEIRSPGDGVLRRLHVEEGQAVEARTPLFLVGPN